MKSFSMSFWTKTRQICRILFFCNRSLTPNFEPLLLIPDMPEDIRDKPYLMHKDILGLNFIRDPGIYFYRRHYRSGLRSHIMQVLNSEDVEKENKGIIIDGLSWYPRAEPLKMLRIFRKRFNTLEDAKEELKKVRVI